MKWPWEKIDPVVIKVVCKNCGARLLWSNKIQKWVTPHGRWKCETDIANPIRTHEARYRYIGMAEAGHRQ